MSNNFLINCIQKIDSKAFQIDYSRISIASNKTVQNMIFNRINNLSHIGMPRIPYWYVELSGQLALDALDSSKVDFRIAEFQTKLSNASKMLKGKDETIASLKRDKIDLMENNSKCISAYMSMKKQLEVVGRK